jgi:aspartate aminotransferase
MIRAKAPGVGYSSIVAIGEEISKIEKETGEQWLKLHRGVMDVTTIDVSSVTKEMDFNDKSLHQYGGNDGHPELITEIKKGFPDTAKVLVTPGGMAALDLVISSLEGNTVWIPQLHWGSWNKILTLNMKETKSFDDMSLHNFRPRGGIVMLCYPSNPTGYCPSEKEIRDFTAYAENNGITIILDLPYWDLLKETSIKDLISRNVIYVSSFSKSIGLSGYRVGYVATESEDLYQSMRTRSLYKYNSISTLPQKIIAELLKKDSLSSYMDETKAHIAKNIGLLKERGLLANIYPSDPIGPFAIISMEAEELYKYRISAVPLKSFAIDRKPAYERMCRISVAVRHDIFREYICRIK